MHLAHHPSFVYISWKSVSSPDTVVTENTLGKRDVSVHANHRLLLLPSTFLDVIPVHTWRWVLIVNKRLASIRKCLHLWRRKFYYNFYIFYNYNLAQHLCQVPKLFHDYLWIEPICFVFHNFLWEFSVAICYKDIVENKEKWPGMTEIALNFESGVLGSFSSFIIFWIAYCVCSVRVLLNQISNLLKSITPTNVPYYVVVI